MIKAQGAHAPKEGQIKLIHLIIVALSFMLTLSAWQFSKIQVEKQIKLVFETSKERTIGLIVDRMNQYEDALWAGVAAEDSHGGSMSYEEWQAFARTLGIEKRHPGVNGIGVTAFLTPQNLESYLSRQRQERPDFSVFPAHDQPFYMPIIFVEPEDANRQAIGLDVAHEQNRREAALASRDTGTAQISGPITLVQDSGKTSGFLFYAPIYRGGPKTDIASRRESFIGTVYAPFVVNRLMGGLLSKERRDIRFSIMDTGTLIYDEHVTEDPAMDPNPVFTEQVSLPLYGRTWTLDIRTDLTFRQNHNMSKPWLILVAGLFIEGLIVALLFQMSRANKGAIKYADEVSIALREKSQTLAATNVELSRKNEEMERFAYVASHDLKTPLRGIGGLTEMLQDDLQDYLASPMAAQEVSENLTRIHERVHRMNELTNGIMEYSRVGTNVAKDFPITVNELTETLAFDLGLKDDQLQSTGDVGVINIDTSNFRRVLENLVGNAVKYHDGVKELQIKISFHSAGSNCRVSVSDNGPGVAPEFHSRIFEVFQTLREGGPLESTGIGLSIVKKAIEKHGGEIALASSLQNGATFSFDWPNVASPEQSGKKVRAA